MDGFEKDNQADDSAFEADNRDLCLCPECNSDLVYPTTWSEVPPTYWEIYLRCPNCERTEVGVFPQSVVEQFDDKLDEYTDTVILNAQILAHNIMAEEIGSFVRALQADAILPEDF